MVSANWFSRKEIFTTLRKDLEDGSLQVGKDYWEPEDWNLAFPTSTKWRKWWFEELLKEREINSYWGEWHTLPRGRQYWIVCR